MEYGFVQKRGKKSVIFFVAFFVVIGKITTFAPIITTHFTKGK